MADADVVHLIHTTTGAFEVTLRALLAQDRPAAREVLRGSEGRRALVSACQEHLQYAEAGSARRLGERMQFVADLGRIGRLVDHLARQVVAATDPVRLPASRRAEIAMLLEAGGRRLRQLASGPGGPAPDLAYSGAGGALFRVADCDLRDRSVVTRLCAALAVTLLQASRHAARAA